MATKPSDSKERTFWEHIDIFREKAVPGTELGGILTILVPILTIIYAWYAFSIWASTPLVIDSMQSFNGGTAALVKLTCVADACGVKTWHPVGSPCVSFNSECKWYRRGQQFEVNLCYTASLLEGTRIAFSSAVKGDARFSVQGTDISSLGSVVFTFQVGTVYDVTLTNGIYLISSVERTSFDGVMKITWFARVLDQSISPLSDLGFTDFDSCSGTSSCNTQLPTVGTNSSCNNDIGSGWAFTHLKFAPITTQLKEQSRSSPLTVVGEIGGVYALMIGSVTSYFVFMRFWEARKSRPEQEQRTAELAGRVEGWRPPDASKPVVIRVQAAQDAQLDSHTRTSVMSPETLEPIELPKEQDTVQSSSAPHTPTTPKKMEFGAEGTQ